MTLIIKSWTFGQHSLVQNAGHQNAFRQLAIKDHMLTMLDASQTGTYILASAAELRICGEFATCLKVADVMYRLILAHVRAV